MCVFSVHCARQVCKSRARFSLSASIDVDGILNSFENQKYKKSKLCNIIIQFVIIALLGEHEVM